MRYHLFLSTITAWCIAATAILAMSPLLGLSLFGRQLSLPFTASIQVHFLDGFQLDFWQSAKALGDKLVTYTHNKLHEAALQTPAASTKIDEFGATMSQIITGAKNLREDLERNAGSISAEEISERLSADLEVVYERFKAEFVLPLPEDHNARHEERIKMVDWAMSEVHVVLIKALPIPEADTSRRFREIAPHVKHVLLVIGQLVDNHPVLFETIIFSAAALLIPEWWLLRPFLSLFGFGPIGPAKGSAAAWAQRRLWGAAVAEGSWFARLQSAGMSPSTGRKIISEIWKVIRSIFGW